MNPKIPFLVELLIHVVAVVVVISLAVRSYELIEFRVVEVVTVPSTSPADTTTSESFTIRGFSSQKGAAESNSSSSSSFDSIGPAKKDVVTIEGKQYQVERSSANQLVWHIIVYGLYLISWFVAYYFFFKRHHHRLKKKLLALLFGWVGFSVLHFGIVITFTVFLNGKASAQPSATILSFGTFNSLTDSPFAFYFLIVFLAFLAQSTVQFLYRYQELEQADHMQSELALIRSQLRPHFFFNTLNNLYSMALETNNEPLADGIQNLTGMMRYSLQHSTKELVPLQDEWDYICRYVELQKLRINQESVKVDLEAKGRLIKAQVAPMILINFVENAFKHGVSYEKPSFVDIKLDVTDKQVILEVRNSNHPSIQDKGTSGIGTAQTKKLLKLYYEDEFQLNIIPTPEEHTSILKLPIR